MTHPLDPHAADKLIPPHMLLAGYASGIFPMADSAEDEEVFWVEPRVRAILPLEGFHLSRSLAKRIRRDDFTVTTDQCFGDVVAACAAPVEGREDTWINPVIRNSYAALHAINHAHSVECWRDGELVGGLYGVSLGGAFFGESMFSRRTDASKVALAWLVARLRVGGFTLLDCQFQTSHLQSLGAIEIPQATYLKRLQSLAVVAAAAGAADDDAAAAGDDAASAVVAAAAAGDWFALDRRLGAAALDDAADPAVGISRSPGQVIVQLLTNTS
jgi:leucyl/phenylalanyl-tRNA--protein transferase